MKRRCRFGSALFFILIATYQTTGIAASDDVAQQTASAIEMIARGEQTLESAIVRMVTQLKDQPDDLYAQVAAYVAAFPESAAIIVQVSVSMAPELYLEITHAALSQLNDPMARQKVVTTAKSAMAENNSKIKTTVETEAQQSEVIIPPPPPPPYSGSRDKPVSVSPN